MTPVSDTSVATATAPTEPQAQQAPRPQSVAQLPNEAIDFANRMFDLARTGDPLLIDYLAAGLPPNLTNNRGDTLLMLASYHGQTNLVRRMLSESQRALSDFSPNASSGVEARRGWRGMPDPNQLNGRGQSIVAGAVFKGFDEVVKVLVEYGADPLAGEPTAEDCAKMFNKWDGEGGYKALFEGAEGRGKGGREAAPAVEDREEERRVPGVGLQRTAAQGEASQEQQQQSSQNEARPHGGAER